MSARLSVKMGHRGNRQTVTVRALALLSHSFSLLVLLTSRGKSRTQHDLFANTYIVLVY